MAASSKRTFTLLIIAVGLGVLGAFLTMLYLKARESSLRDMLKPKSEPIAIVVASKDLLKGDILDTSSLSIRKIPSNFVDANAVRPQQFDAIAGKVIQQNLATGKMLLHSFVAAEFPLDFSDTIDIKRRAMTIQVDEMSTFTGLLRPGNRIDLFVNISNVEGSQKNIVPVLENVEVLTTGRDSARDYSEKVRFLRGGVDPGINQNFTTVTLNVTPKEGAILATAKDKGDLLALLRNRKDTSGSGFSKVSLADVSANAQKLAEQELVRQRAQQLSQSVVKGTDGVLRTKDGVALANQNLIIGEDGSIRTKSGIDLTGRGLSLNDKGEIVDKDGNVIDPDSLMIADDGSVISKDGKVLNGNKVRTLAGLKESNGQVILPDGTVIKGARLNENGDLIMADGSVVKAQDLVINSDGSISDKNGNAIAGLTAAKSLQGIAVNDAGEVVLPDGTVISGVKMDRDGNIVLPDGSVVRPEDLVINSDGSLVTNTGQIVAKVDALKRVVRRNLSRATIDYIAGGVSKDGIATVQKLPVAPSGQ